MALLCSPHEMGVPETRYRSLLMYSQVLDSDDLTEVVHDYNRAKDGSRLAPLEMFMLADDDNILEEELQRQLQANGGRIANNLANVPVEKWNKRGKRSAQGKTITSKCS